jgi:penicillin G amidase
MKILRKGLLLVLAILALLAAGIGTYLYTLKPNYSQNLLIPGLKAEVEVLYDNYGIPHIYAQNEEDLFMAFGYVHAQDRLFQMEVLRRLADGRLSEVFGEKALPSDKFFRTLSFREQAKWTIATVYKDPNAPFVKAAKAYLKGINHYIKQGKTPLEFTITGIPKTEFTLEDMEIIVGYMGYTFVGAFHSEAIATKIKTELGDEYLRDIMSAWPDDKYKIPVNGKEDLALQKASDNLSQMAVQLDKIGKNLAFAPFHGSNGWVLAGSKTKSGKPILANDTHIAFSQPSVWYEAHLECPGFKIYGNFLAGTLVPALGHSEKGGWGLTMFENDDADFFRETKNPKNNNQVLYKGQYEDLKIRKETIAIKGENPYILEVKKSRHGYIMNGSFDKIDDQKDPIALWWVFHQFPSRHLEVFYNISHASNATEARFAVQPLTSPGLNFMWADTSGNIAWWAAGKLPKRPTHVNPQVILDGASGNDDPLGWYDFDWNPQILNPKRGVLYTANNQPKDMGNGLVPGYYVPSNRAHRIEELLFTNKNDWTEAELRNIINDTQSSSYPEVLKSILPILETKKLSPQANVAVKQLMAWDGSHDLDDVEPTIFYKFLYETLQLALKDELGTSGMKSIENELSLKRNTMAFLKKDASKWWDNKKTKTVETRKDILTKAMNEAVFKIGQQLSNNQEKWMWSAVHTIEHKHPLGILPIVGKFFNVGPIPVVGGQETINNMEFNMDSTGVYNVLYGPALRRIVDFANVSKGQSVNPTGQSGNVLSPFYKDQALMFTTGGKRPELMNRKDIEKVSVGRTVFEAIKK